MNYMNTNYFVLKPYPVRDKRLVEKIICPSPSIPLGMQPLKRVIAYLRHAIMLGNIFFYPYYIPNGMIKKHSKYSRLLND